MLSSALRRVLIAGAVLALLAGAALPALRLLLRRWENNPVLAGRELAEELGCPACHLTRGSFEIPNPGSRWGSVPRFGAGNSMMYLSGLEEVEEFIRHGAPRAWLDDPAVVERLASQHLRMPAYGDRVSDARVAELVAWVAAVEGIDRPGGEEVAAGRKLARDHGCLACHGVEGSGGLPNPGSLGGFVPGFLGKNFDDLVADRAEFEEWVLTGTSGRLAANPVVRWFWRRQKLQMPAYREELDPAQVELLWRWVQASRAALAGS
ncbi:MAG: c-type cytochrome [Thermoanaerobaculia bacterium]|nr:c-type cytochrome [Thermoanaerobaculia bacterium]